MSENTDDAKALVERLRTRYRMMGNDEDSKSMQLALWAAADTIERLSRELAEAQRDTRRLDWLDLPTTSFNDVSRAVRLAQGKITTYRAAIDAAMGARDE